MNLNQSDEGSRFHEMSDAKYRQRNPRTAACTTKVSSTKLCVITNKILYKANFCRYEG